MSLQELEIIWGEMDIKITTTMAMKIMASTKTSMEIKQLADLVKPVNQRLKAKDSQKQEEAIKRKNNYLQLLFLKKTDQLVLANMIQLTK